MSEDRNNFEALENQGISAATYGGVFSSQSSEPVVEFLAADGDKVYHNLDTWIIMGRDRNAGRDSGYGGRGDVKASMIDFVVGRTPPAYEPELTTQYADPNFLSDAVRVYASQKTNLDEYFGLTGENVEERGKSGLGVKADYVRVIARNSLRLVTTNEDKNSRGGINNKRYGIELVAGNDAESLQPMALGKNLVDALISHAKLMDQIATVIDTLVQIQVTHLNAVSPHFHYSPFNGLPTTPSEINVIACSTTAAALLTQVSGTIAQLKMNMAKFQMNYLSASGEKSILSPLNKTN